MTSRMPVVLAIDAGGTYYKSALVSTTGHCIPGSESQTKVSQQVKPEEMRKLYWQMIQRLLNLACIEEYRAVGICIDTPGPFDYENGISRMQHKYKNLYGVPQKPWVIEAGGGLPIRYLHDSTAFLLGEVMQYPELELLRTAGVMLGTGLGFAYRIDQKMQLNPRHGPAVSLYNQPYQDGIAEDYVSRRGIIARYHALSRNPGEEIDVKEIADRAYEKEEAAIQTFRDLGIYLGEILSPYISEFSLEAIVLGGQISKAYPLFGKTLQEALQREALNVKILRAKDPDASHLIGCAAYFGH